MSSSVPLDFPACLEDPPRSPKFDSPDTSIKLEEIPGHLDKDDIALIEHIVSPSKQVEPFQQKVQLLQSTLRRELGEVTYIREVIIANHPLLPHLENAMDGVVPRQKIDLSHAETLQVGMREVDEVLLDALRILAAEDSSSSSSSSSGTLHCSLDAEAKLLLEETSRRETGKPNGQQIEQQEQEKPPSETVTPETPRRRKRICKARPTTSRANKRGATPSAVQQVLKEWLFAHAHSPYPGEEEKDALCLRTGLTMHQLNNWFINARRRILPAHLKSLESNAKSL